MSYTGTIVQVSVSPGGVPKLPVPQARVTANGIEGDGHDHPDIHGGPERALCIYALERIEGLAAEGHDLAPGHTGENITIRGIDWDLVVPGARFKLGVEVEVEVTRFTTPCKTNARWFKGGDFNRMHHNLFPGWSRAYARVISTGTVRPGDVVELTPPASA